MADGALDPAPLLGIADNGRLHISARRSGLTDGQIEQWAHSLADRLQAAEVIADADIEVRIQPA